MEYHSIFKEWRDFFHENPSAKRILLEERNLYNYYEWKCCNCPSERFESLISTENPFSQTVECLVCGHRAPLSWGVPCGTLRLHIVEFKKQHPYIWKSVYKHLQNIPVKKLYKENI